MDSPLRFEGRLDIYGASEFRQSLAAGLKGAGALTVDLADVEAYDVTALQLLIAARKSAQAAGKQLTIVAANTELTRACEALGLDAREILAWDAEQILDLTAQKVSL